MHGVGTGSDIWPYKQNHNDRYDNGQWYYARLTSWNGRKRYNQWNFQRLLDRNTAKSIKELFFRSCVWFHRPSATRANKFPLHSFLVCNNSSKNRYTSFVPAKSVKVRPPSTTTMWKFRPTASGLVVCTPQNTTSPTSSALGEGRGRKHWNVLRN